MLCPLLPDCSPSGIRSTTKLPTALLGVEGFIGVEGLTGVDVAGVSGDCPESDELDPLRSSGTFPERFASCGPTFVQNLGSWSAGAALSFFGLLSLWLRPVKES